MGSRTDVGAADTDRAEGGRRPSLGRRLAGLSAAQWYSLVVGALLAVRALTTLFAGASFALPGDGWRASFQLVVAVALLAGLPSRTRAHATVLAVALTYLVVSVAGIVNGHSVLGVMPLDMRDKIVHPLLAVVALAATVGRGGATARPLLRA